MSEKSINNIDKMRVIHILNTGSYSGAENVVITIINAMKNNSNTEFVYVSLDGSIRGILESYNIKYEPIKKMSVSEIRRVVKKYNPDIIHAHDYTASMICALSMVNLHIISHLHNNSPWIKEYGLKSVAFLATCPRYKKILMVSDSVINEYIFGRYIKNKSKTIGNPIDISIIQDKALQKIKNTNRYDIVFLGRLATQKNPIRFISIIKQLLQHMPKLQVAMIGNGHLEEECLSLIKKYKLESNIHVLGFMNNPYPILKQSKLLCITSDWEGYGLVAVEALALGKPVVATPVGGLIDIVNKECGKLCEDDEEFISEISNLLNNNMYYEEKVNSANKRASYINNINLYTENLYKLYLSI